MKAGLLAAAVGFVLANPLTAFADPCDGFADVDSAATYCAALFFVKDRGITVGCGDGSNYCPNDYVTRAQMALFMQRQARGGADNSLFDSTTVIGGGNDNHTLASYATIAGGQTNSSDSYASIGGGLKNGAEAYASTVGGGHSNHASAEHSTVSGGFANNASGQYASISGGASNTASANGATVAGGENNDASAVSSFAAGYRAKASTTGSFIWADYHEFDFEPSVSNFFGARATGGVGFTVAINASGGSTQFCNLLPGVPSWQCVSDVNAKENLVVVDAENVLDRLAAMPIYTYNMKESDPGIRSMGPTAQDFHAAFGLGNDEHTIATINLEGVALAAIKGLKAELDAEKALLATEHDANAELREQNASIAGQNASLLLRLEALERAVAR